jgi:hypothetical protein
MYKPDEVKKNWKTYFKGRKNSNLKNTRLVSSALLKRRFPSQKVGSDSTILAVRFDSESERRVVKVFGLEDESDDIKGFVTEHAYVRGQIDDDDEADYNISMFTKKNVSSTSEKSILSNIRKHFVQPSVTLRIYTKPYVPESQRHRPTSICECLQSVGRVIMEMGQCALCLAICFGVLLVILVPLYLHARNPSVDVNLVYEFQKPILTANSKGGHLDLDGVVRYSVRNDGWIPVCLDEVKAKMFYVRGIVLMLKRENVALSLSRRRTHTHIHTNSPGTIMR